MFCVLEPKTISLTSVAAATTKQFCPQILHLYSMHFSILLFFL